MLRFGWGFQFCICIHVDNNFRQKSKFRNFWSKTCFVSKIHRFLEFHHNIILFLRYSLLLKSKAFTLKCIHKKITAIERNCRNFNGGHLPYFCILHFGGLPYLTERSSVCDFDRTVKFLSNDSQIIATYAGVSKYTVKLNMSEKIILKVMIPFFFPVYIEQMLIVRCKMTLTATACRFVFKCIRL